MGHSDHIPGRFCVKEILARSNSSEVYEAGDMDEWTSCALKVINKSCPVGEDFERRRQDYDIISRIPIHPHIVQVTAVQLISRDDLMIVMELCEETSLVSFMKQPENAYGLDDVSFMNLLECLAEGLPFLRTHCALRSDLLPENILVAKDDYGRYVFKLSGFRQNLLESDANEFMESFPDHEGEPQDTVELWLIGSLLYQAATGQPLFRSTAGRTFLHNLFTFIAERDTFGVSCRPRRLGIVFPTTAQLSRFLCLRMKPLLEGLLSANSKTDLPSFVEAVRNQKSIMEQVVHVFFANQVQYLLVYLRGDGSIPGMQEVVQKLTGVQPKDQLFFFAERPLGEALPETSRRDPLYLIALVPTICPTIPEYDMSAGHEALREWPSKCKAYMYLMARIVQDNCSCRDALATITKISHVEERGCHALRLLTRASSSLPEYSKRHGQVERLKCKVEGLLADLGINRSQGPCEEHHDISHWMIRELIEHAKSARGLWDEVRKDLEIIGHAHTVDGSPAVASGQVPGRNQRSTSSTNEEQAGLGAVGQMSYGKRKSQDDLLQILDGDPADCQHSPRLPSNGTVASELRKAPKLRPPMMPPSFQRSLSYGGCSPSVLDGSPTLNCPTTSSSTGPKSPRRTPHRAARRRLVSE